MSMFYYILFMNQYVKPYICSYSYYNKQNQMAEAGGHSRINHEIHPEKSRLDDIIPKNEELLNNLNLKIDRRINNGYYFHVAAKRKSFVYSPRNKNPTIKKKPKVHPVFKKITKPNEERPAYVDQEQNTDQIEFCQEFQNTSGEYVLKKPDPILENEQMQWSCEETEVQQRNQSIQWSIEPIQQANQGIQYTLESELVIVQCRDASIQYTLESQPQPQPQPEPEPVVKVVCQDAQIQCEKVRKEQISLQFDEPLPQTKQSNLQIDLPDLKQLNKISSMETRIKYLKHEQRKQQKLQKKKEQQIQILKLKEVMKKLEGKIELAQVKEQNLKKQIQGQMIRKEREKQKEKLFFREKNQLKQEMQRQYNNNIQTLLSKIKQGSQTQKRSVSNNSYREEEQKRIAQLKRQELESKKQLQNYKKEVQDLKTQLKNQMFKRLNYQDQSDDETATQQEVKERTNSQHFDFSHRKKSDVSMDSLFPIVKNRYAGSIVKNIPEKSNISLEQKRLNDHEESVKKARAYWRQKSPFEYQYKNLSLSRFDRKSSYLQKISNKKLENVELDQSINPERINQLYPLIKPRTRFQTKNRQQKSNKYLCKKLSFDWKQLNEIKKRFDDLYSNEELFHFLYSEEDKIHLGLKLFENLGVIIDNKLKQPITIYKYPNYIVFQYKTETSLQFIIFCYERKSVVAGKTSLLTTNTEFYASPLRYKNGQILQYLNQNELYHGFYTNGQRQIFGILSNDHVHYQGQFACGKKQGKGKLILQNGDIYIGQFKENNFNGDGVYKWTNGQTYDGYFEHGQKCGFGKHYFKNGDIYQGEYKNNKRNGRGTYKWKEGPIFQGIFIDDNKQGTGRLTNENGEVIVGEWKDDKKIEQVKEKRKYFGGEAPLGRKIKAV